MSSPANEPMAGPGAGPGFAALPQRIGKYPVLRELGAGATSRVYLAEDPFADRQVAIKVIRRDAFGDAEQRRRIQSLFLNEAALAGKLAHPHIAAIHDAIDEADASYLVMEFVDGTTLSRHCSFDALLPMERVVEIAFKAGLALAYAAQQGVIHCDIKPGNLLLAGGNELKITDFGAAQYASAQHTYLSGVGSPAYMSPEQVADRQLNHQTDIYSLGVVLYQLLTGKLPFQGTTRESLMYQIMNIEPQPPSRHRPAIPAGLDRVVLRAIAKSREERYSDWREFARDLARLFDHLSLPEQSYTDAERFSALRLLPMLQDFGDVEIWETLRIGLWHRMPAGTIVVEEGETGDGFFVLAAGEALVSRAQVPLETLQRGHCFGEILYFEGGSVQRATTISASTPLIVLEIKARALASASAACQMQFNKAFLRILVKRIERLQQRVAEGPGAVQP